MTHIEAMKIVAVGLPTSIEDYQLALNAAFAGGVAAGKAIATEESSAVQEPVEFWSVANGWETLATDDQKPFGYVNRDEVIEHMASVSCGTIYRHPAEGRLPLYTHPQPKAEQDEVDIRSRLYQRVHELESLLKDIAEYTGAGPSTTDWQGIVKLISESARDALESQPKAGQDRHELQKDGKHPAPCAKFCEANAFNIEIRGLRSRIEQLTAQQEPKREWVGLTAEEREQHRDDWRSNIHDQEIFAIQAKLKEKNT